MLALQIIFERTKLKIRSLAVSVVALCCSIAVGQSGVLNVPIDPTRSRDEIGLRSDNAVKRVAANLWALSEGSRTAKAKIGRYHAHLPLLTPFVVKLTVGGQALPYGSSGRGIGAPLSLSFVASGPRSFSPAYQALLQDVFDEARPTMDLVFGEPSVGGPVIVANYDADIGDRDAVAGGYFLPNNGSGQPEIRTAVYLSPEASAVNFVHTLLLAYLGPNQYAFDAYQEGLVRAATMRIVRTPGALPAGLDLGEVEKVLANSYDVGAHYDWYNQRGLGGPRFIAPNLRDVPLPAGGSVGGIYLLRYRMAGAVWQKVLAQYPSFAARLNERLYANPAIGSSTSALTTNGQQVIDELGGAGSQVEGLSYSSWVLRQFIMQTYLTRGLKLVTEATPITSGLAGPDFGVFLIEAHYFSTSGNGNEILLSGTSFPIFWEGQDFLNRVFPSAQEDRMDIAGAYGSVVPNLLNLHSGQSYRAISDVPVQDQVARTYLPAGAIATASNPTENTFYGTLLGASGTLRVRVKLGATTLAEPTVSFGAFGANITNSGFLGYASLVMEVVQTVASVETVIYSRRVNKGPGGLAVDLRVGGESTYDPPGNLPGGIFGLGMPVDLFNSHIPALLGIPTAETLAARFNPSRSAYDLFPELEPFKIGHAYFARLPAPDNRVFTGRIHPQIGVGVALRPGWNLISCPLLETVPTGRIRVVTGAEFPRDWPDALGTELGTEFFRFVQGPVDPASGFPETGSFVVATDFQPGEAYYVRVLAPEGVTLLFEPAPAPLAVSRRPAREGWLAQFVVTGGGRSSDSFLGATRTATRGFDPKQDSGSPPPMGALQAVFETSQRLHQDIRTYGAAETHRLRLEGMTPGGYHTLKLFLSHGSIPHLRVKDDVTGFVRNLRPGASFSFRPSKTVQTFTVTVPTDLGDAE